MSLLATLLGLALLAAAPKATLDVRTSPSEIYVGDHVIIDLEVTLTEEKLPVFPQWQETWGEAEIRQVGEIQMVAAEDGSRTFLQQLTVAFYRTGEIVLPAPTIAAGAGAARGEESPPALLPTQPIAVTVKSLLPPGDEIPEPKPPVSPLQLAWGHSFLWTTAILGALSLVAVAVLIRRRSSGLAADSAPLDPLRVFEAALDDLRSESDMEKVFTAVSLHLRRFFGRTLGFPAAESTTSEIRRRFLERELPTDLVRRTEGLLRECDGVKFARRKVAPQNAERGLSEASEIGMETIRALTPPPPEEVEEIA